MNELVAGALAVLGMGLMLFGLGAISAWWWAMKSLRIRPPGWITGVTAAAGASMSAAFVVGDNWLSAVSTAFVFALVVGGQLQIGPFGRSGRGEAP